jgi:hypothetical protein
MDGKYDDDNTSERPSGLKWINLRQKAFKGQLKYSRTANCNRGNRSNQEKHLIVVAKEILSTKEVDDYDCTVLAGESVQIFGLFYSQNRMPVPIRRQCATHIEMSVTTNKVFATLSKVILVPHCLWWTQESGRRTVHQNASRKFGVSPFDHTLQGLTSGSTTCGIRCAKSLRTFLS